MSYWYWATSDGKPPPPPEPKPSIFTTFADDELRHGNDPGCSACGTCIDHDSCADPDNPIDLDRGDCPECGACGGCIALCATTPATLEP